MNKSQWEKLEGIAQGIIAEALEELPPEIVEKARGVPCLFQEYSEEDPDLLGIYSDFEPGRVATSNGPIILYLAAIRDYCHEEGEDYAEEVRITYLHELGHHFGWDEDDLEERGLL